MAGEEIFSRFPTSYGWNEVDWVAPKAKTQPRQNRFRFRILQKRPEVFLGTHCDVLAWPFWENNENGIESFLFNSSPIRFVPTGRQLGKKNLHRHSSKFRLTVPSALWPKNTRQWTKKKDGDLDGWDDNTGIQSDGVLRSGSGFLRRTRTHTHKPADGSIVAKRDPFLKIGFFHFSWRFFSFASAFIHVFSLWMQPLAPPPTTTFCSRWLQFHFFVSSHWTIGETFRAWKLNFLRLSKKPISLQRFRGWSQLNADLLWFFLARTPVGQIHRVRGQNTSRGWARNVVKKKNLFNGSNRFAEEQRVRKKKAGLNHRRTIFAQATTGEIRGVQSKYVENTRKRRLESCIDNDRVVIKYSSTIKRRKRDQYDRSRKHVFFIHNYIGTNMLNQSPKYAHRSCLKLQDATKKKRQRDCIFTLKLTKLIEFQNQRMKAYMHLCMDEKKIRLIRVSSVTELEIVSSRE